MNGWLPVIVIVASEVAFLAAYLAAPVPFDRVLAPIWEGFKSACQAVGRIGDYWPWRP